MYPKMITDVSHVSIGNNESRIQGVTLKIDTPIDPPRYRKELVEKVSAEWQNV